MRRGILGGTFDPPHVAHLVAGEAALHQANLDVVTFLPAGSPWQKAGTDVTPAEHRLEMTSLAIAGVTHFEADDREVRRAGWSYMADTLASFPDDEELVLILGADAAAGLHTWVRSDDVRRRAELAVMPRPGVERRTVEANAGAHVWLDTPLLPISGTLLRTLCRDGRSIRFLVPAAVLDYLEEHRLYVPES